MIRFPEGLPNVGTGVHRAGWPYAMQALEPLVSADGILVDDFVERSFLYRSKKARAWTEPWIGVFHHPPHMPDWFLPHAPIERLLMAPTFVASLPYLRGTISLSAHLGDWLKDVFNRPTAVVKHPSDPDVPQFSMAAYLKEPTLVQVGWYLRNQDVLSQLRVPATIKKIRLKPKNENAHKVTVSMRTGSPYAQRPRSGSSVQAVEHLPNAAYDALLARAVVVMEYITVSASNAIVECIARATPAIVNRHTALEEYLGADYPLFYDDFSQAKALLEPARIEAAHEHLKAMDRRFLHAEAWRESIAGAVAAITGVRRAA